jgi:hypothetical protein
MAILEQSLVHWGIDFCRVCGVFLSAGRLIRDQLESYESVVRKV